MRTLLFALSFIPSTVLSSEYAWLESEWISESGTRIIIEDGFMTTYSCGTEYRKPYFILPITASKFELLYELSVPYNFVAERTEKGLCLTFPPIWDEDLQKWMHSDGVCYSRKEAQKHATNDS